MSKNKICYNCAHSGTRFKISGRVHMHCCHPKYTKEDFDKGEFSAWDTLMEWWDKCSDFEPKEPKK